MAHRYLKVDNETQRSYNCIAQMLDNSDMKSIMTIFAEKLMMNLVYSKYDEDDSKRIISITLDTLSFYSGSLSSCRMLANTEIMQQIIKNGISSFKILEHPSQMKMLGQFFKILLQLWLNEDYVRVFEQNIGQLNPAFEELLAVEDDLSIRSNQDNRTKVLRLFHILRGLFKGAFTHKNFSILFDWFYPDYFGIIKKCLNAYIQEPCDDEVVLLILKFLGDLVDNSSNRLRFDTWSINGLIVYKEGATLIIQFLELFNCLQKKPLRYGDKYKEQLRFLKITMHFLEKCVSGNYINFAICEYYNDNTFTQLS